MFPRAEKNLVEVEEIGLYSQASRGLLPFRKN